MVYELALTVYGGHGDVGAGAVCLLRCAACLHSFCIDLSMSNKSGTDKSPLFAAWQQILLKEMF